MTLLSVENAHDGNARKKSAVTAGSITGTEYLLLAEPAPNYCVFSKCW